MAKKVKLIERDDGWSYRLEANGAEGPSFPTPAEASREGHAHWKEEFGEAAE